MSPTRAPRGAICASTAATTRRRSPTTPARPARAVLRAGHRARRADVVINIPKLKTHKKTAVTLSLKSVIGLSNEKYWLPHFTGGDPSRGGDEFDRRQSLADRIENKLSRFPRPGDHSLIARAPRVGGPPKVIDGSWQGNDTLWRTVLDLNRILFFADQGQAPRHCPSGAT